MKRSWYILLAIIAILLALSMAKNTIIKFGIEKSVTGITGMKLSVLELKVGLIRHRVDIKDLYLYNPTGFRDKVMLDMPEIYFDYDLPAFFGGKLHFEEMTIDMKEFVVVKNSKGEVNVNAFMSKASDDSSKPESQKKRGMQLQIDVLNLKAGKVTYKDYSQGGKPKVQVFDVGIDQQYKNITDLKSLVSLIMVKTLAKTSIAKIANIELNKLEKMLTSKIISSPSSLLSLGGGAAGMVESAIGGVLKSSIPEGEEKE